MDVSSEAKNHYVNALIAVMIPLMEKTFVDMYKEAIERTKGARGDVVQKTFKVLLDEVANWNNTIIQSHSKEYTVACPYFSDLLAAVFVCYIKILSSVRLTKDAKKINIKLPTNDNFIHACLNNAAIEFGKNMNIFREPDDMKRTKMIHDVCARSITKTLNDLIPMQTILRTYVNPDTSEFSFGEDVEGDETKDIPLDEEAVDEEPGPVTEPEPESAPEPEQPEPVDQAEKTIPVAKMPQQIAHPAPDLFDDAPMGSTKPKIMGATQ